MAPEGLTLVLRLKSSAFFHIKDKIGPWTLRDDPEKNVMCFVCFLISISIIISKITFVLICHTWLNMTKIGRGPNLNLAISEKSVLPCDLEVQKIGANYLLTVLLSCCQKKVFSYCDFCIIKVWKRRFLQGTDKL